MLRTRDEGLAVAPMFPFQQQAVCGRTRGEGNRGSQLLRLLMSLSLVDRMSSEGLGRDVFAITFVASPISVGVRGEQVINVQTLCHGRVLPRETTWLAAIRWQKKDF